MRLTPQLFVALAVLVTVPLSGATILFTEDFESGIASIDFNGTQDISTGGSDTQYWDVGDDVSPNPNLNLQNSLPGQGTNTFLGARNQVGTAIIPGVGVNAGLFSTITISLDMFGTELWGDAGSVTLTGVVDGSDLASHLFLPVGGILTNGTLGTINDDGFAPFSFDFGVTPGSDVQLRIDVVASGSNNRNVLFDNIEIAGDNPIPEPSTYLLMGLGLSGLALLRRRRSA